MGTVEIARMGRGFCRDSQDENGDCRDSQDGKGVL